MDGFQGLAAAGVIALVILQGDVFRVFHLQALEQNIEGRLIILIILFDLTGPDHLHDHRKVLLIFRGFVVEIEDQSE